VEGGGVSFLDYLLEHDATGEVRTAVARQQVDLDAGITWGVFDGDDLLVTYPSRFQAEAEARDCADATNQPPFAYAVRPVVAAQQAVAA
jgi:hypothetical protein